MKAIFKWAGLLMGQVMPSETLNMSAKRTARLVVRRARPTGKAARPDFSIGQPANEISARVLKDCFYVAT
jgi:hypothetical protein